MEQAAYFNEKETKLEGGILYSMYFPLNSAVNQKLSKKYIF